MGTHEDLGENRFSTSSCMSSEAIEWDSPSDETEKPRPRVTAGVAR
jgi:hypothetical protein